MANKPQRATVDLPDDIRHGIKSGLVKHGKVKVIGLGIFETRKIPARLGRDPRSGEIIKIRSYWKVKFRPTKSLKTAVC